MQKPQNTETSIISKLERERKDLPLGENGVVFGSFIVFSLVYSGDDGEGMAVAEIHSEDNKQQVKVCFFLLFFFSETFVLFL